MRWIDAWLDRITMYRLLLYFLIVLVVAAAGLSALGVLFYKPLNLLLAAAYSVAVCWLANHLFGQIWRVPINRESSLITGLILALIITPPTTVGGVLFLTAAGVLAMASKYLLTIRHQNIFNPAAIAVVLTALAANQAASWWVGTKPLLPFVLIGGLLLMRKLRRGQMLTTFIVTTLLATAFYCALTNQSVATNLHYMVLNSALFFFAFVMLTEPQTSPNTLERERWYAVLAGLLFPPQAHLGSLYSTPELTLVISNIFAFIISPRPRLTPILKKRLSLTPYTFDFIFEPNRPLKYLPGQYMEWTLPHKQADSRGTRRYFTLASSPTESTLRLGVKFYENGSSYKHALLGMNARTRLAAAQLSGDFVLPKDKSQKLAFIAGGIGITPYRSMLKYLLDMQESRPIKVLYVASNSQDFVYRDVIEAARQQLNVATTYLVSDEGKPIAHNPHILQGRLDAALLQQEVPDFLERIFYISGPHGMVTATKDILTHLGVPGRQIKIDFFPGYA